MGMYVESGENRMECELKIARKYNRPFEILREKEINVGGFLGLFSKPGVQVEFCFSTPLRKPISSGNAVNINGLQRIAALEEEKIKVLAAARQSSARETSLPNVQNLLNQGRINAGKGTSEEILDMLKELKDKIEVNAGKEEHPAFVHMTGLLKMNDFSDSYINNIIEKMRK